MTTQAWEHQQRFLEVKQLWQSLVPSKTLANSRPVFIAQNILWIATPSTTWSQHLNLQRYRLLQRLNSQLTSSLKDLRCSTAYWRHSPAISALADRQALHPSRSPVVATENCPASSDPKLVVAYWLQQHQKRMRDEPCCPRCQASAPSGELQRWGVCSCCFAQQWHQKTQFFIGDQNTLSLD